MYNHNGYKSGGVCVHCQHKTMGTNCEICRAGFYRNRRFPYNSTHACKGNSMSFS